jgi:hypothetical protein
MPHFIDPWIVFQRRDEASTSLSSLYAHESFPNSKKFEMAKMFNLNAFPGFSSRRSGCAQWLMFENSWKDCDEALQLSDSLLAGGFGPRCGPLFKGGYPIVGSFCTTSCAYRQC